MAGSALLDDLDLLASEEKPGDTTREEMAKAGLSAFFSIINEWDLSSEEAGKLLGSPSRSRFYDLRQGKPSACRGLSDDELDRLAYIAGIYSGLNILYHPDSHGEWLRNESRLPAEALYRPWGAGSPLGYMLSGKLKALADVYEYVNSERGGM